MFSVARSRYTSLSQLVFLALNALGLVFGVIYNANTPDLYENNAHHKIGWIATWIVSAQAIVGLVRHYTRNTDGASFSSARYETLKEAHSPEEYRWSRDSGHGTEPNSPRSSCPASPAEVEHNAPRDAHESQREEDEYEEKHGLLRKTVAAGYIKRSFEAVCSSRAVRIAGVLYDIADRTVLFLGFIALATGIVTYGGHFVSMIPKWQPLSAKG